MTQCAFTRKEGSNGISLGELKSGPCLPDRKRVWASEPWGQEVAAEGSWSRKMRGEEDDSVKQLLDGQQELERISLTGSQAVERGWFHSDPKG